VFESPCHKILFEETALISNELGIGQVVQEATEIRIKINNNISLNKGLGEYSEDAQLTNLIKNDLTEYYNKPIDINQEPVANTPMRSAAKNHKKKLERWL